MLYNDQENAFSFLIFQGVVRRCPLGCVAEGAWPALRRLLSDGKRHRHRESTLSTSEVMTIVILFQISGFRNLKTYYTQYVCKHLRGEFPDLVSYGRFVELQSKIVLPLAAFLHTRFGPCTGISFIDSCPCRESA